MKSCETYKMWMIDAVSGEIPDAGMAELQEHLDSCEQCSKDFRDIQVTLNNIPDDLIADESEMQLMADDTIASLRDLQNTKQQRRRQLKMSGRILAAAAVLIVGIFLGRLSVDEYESEQLVQSAQKMQTSVHNAALEKRTASFLDRSRILLLGMVNMDEASVKSGALDFSHQKEVSKDLVIEAADLRKELKGTPYQRMNFLINQLQTIMTQIANLEQKFDLPEVDLIKSGVFGQAILMKIDVEELKIRQQQQAMPGKKKSPQSVKM